MKTKKKKGIEDFKLAKGIFIFSHLFGCGVGVYLIFSCIMGIIDSFADNQMGWAIVFLIGAVFILYLVIDTGKKALQAFKAKNVSELP
ncbi:hypothetical protein HHO41_21050 [Bacillus sp. DNRA2]|uniref:hypothetical protein n=1 Tax=Bacillus sp. DNRA2 TaxID=2723053 RepID=UPI00145C8E57|nr:hypothetical protein [Bacillus sp. DNRA2]NMD72718.1 hypothetical protein [Bacillus sp. DNRA2]